MHSELVRTSRILAFCLSAALLGCSNGDRDPLPGSPARTSLITADHGLQLRQWRIADQPEVTAQAMRRFSENILLDESTMLMLRRNGLRLRRIPLQSLDALRDALGEPSMNIDTWYGQAHQWQMIAAAPIRPEPTGIAVDGLIRRFQGGRLELLFRGWTVPMEDGPAMLLELLPRYSHGRPRGFEELLRGRRFDGEYFRSMNIELLMNPGWAYLLMYESPSVEWDGKNDGVRASAPERSALTGPDALAPLTVGEMLLREQGTPPRRRVLLFVPRIPARAYPPEHRAAAAGAGGAGETP